MSYIWANVFPQLQTFFISGLLRVSVQSVRLLRCDQQYLGTHSNKRQHHASPRTVSVEMRSTAQNFQGHEVSQPTVVLPPHAISRTGRAATEMRCRLKKNKFIFGAKKYYLKRGEELHFYFSKVVLLSSLLPLLPSRVRWRKRGNNHSQFFLSQRVFF